MGQRHQIYIVTKRDTEYRALSAHHHQWCYGLVAASNLLRLCMAAERAIIDDGKWQDYFLRDPRECDTLVKYIYGVDPESGHVSMVHDETEHLIEGDFARPERGDNNDGAALIVIDHDSKEVRGCLFTPGHVEGEFGNEAKAWTPWGPITYLDFYYRGEALAEVLKNSPHRAKFLETRLIKPVLHDEFKQIFKASLTKPRKRKQPEARA